MKAYLRDGTVIEVVDCGQGGAPHLRVLQGRADTHGLRVEIRLPDGTLRVAALTELRLEWPVVSLDREISDHHR